ncbi:MAG: hypothetical protein K1X94_18865 [Sandaracinaceae bacterium]|nr:hypothetical protein [Sandaracinaceae bacterium]
MSASDGFDPATFFQEGGAAMYLVLCIGALSHVLALAALGSMLAKRRAMPLGFGAATLLFALSTACTGVGGYLMGMRNVEDAVAFADPELQARLRAQGQEECDNNLYFGGCAFLFPFFAGLVAVGRGAMMKDGPPTA